MSQSLHLGNVLCDSPRGKNLSIPQIRWTQHLLKKQLQEKDALVEISLSTKDDTSSLTPLGGNDFFSSLFHLEAKSLAGTL